jgi:hypothetical protein
MTNLKILKSLGFDNRVKYRSFRAITLVVIICLLSVLPASAQENHHSIEFLGTLQSYMLNQHYDFTPGFGAEAQIRFWPKTNLGFRNRNAFHTKMEHYKKRQKYLVQDCWI